MDLEKRRNRLAEERKQRMYMDLKDIVREHTLPYLPAKSLVKFRAVCWDWNRWILNPFLAHNQSYFFHDVSGFFVQSQGAQPSFVSLDPSSCGIPDRSLEFLKAPVDIRTTSNGLICCQSRTGEKPYYVCNPVNKQFKLLPKPNCYHGVNPAPVLIFEPSLLSFAANYKVVCAFPSSDFDDGHEFEIYSSETGLWKLSGEICFGERMLVPESGVHVKGIVYWLATDYIIAFDLVKDRSRLIERYCSMRSGCLGEMHGELCCISSSNRSIVVKALSNVHSNTKGMSSGYGIETGRMWTEKHRVSLNNIVAPMPLSMEGLHFLFASGTVVIAQVGEDTVISCDIRTKKIAVLPLSLGPITGRYIPYVNSLASMV